MIRIKRGRSLLLLASAALAAVGSVSLSATTLYDSGGFEPTRFLPGTLTGQDPTLGPWQTDNTASSAIVQSAITKSGTQSVQVTRSATTTADERWAVIKPITPANRYVDIDWDEYVVPTTLTGVNFGPMLGVESYDSKTTPFGQAVIGSTYVDATTGEVLFQDADTGAIDNTPADTHVAFNSWNHFTMQLDYTTHTYQIYLNGVQIESQGFVDQNNINGGGGITGFNDAPIAAVAFPDTTADSAAPGTAYFDNFAINTSASAVPEPTTLGLLALGLLGAVSRRRKVTA